MRVDAVYFIIIINRSFDDRREVGGKTEKKMFRSLYKAASKAATSLEHSLDTVLSNGPESHGAFVNTDVRIGDKMVRLGRVVAEGGYSFIHIARLPSAGYHAGPQNNNACYAVKRVGLTDEEGRAAAEREVRVLELIKQGSEHDGGGDEGHEHIVRYYGASEWKGYMFFLFDFIDGGTLHERLPAIHQRHHQQKQQPHPTPHHHPHHHHTHMQLGGHRHEDRTTASSSSSSSSSSSAGIVACEILDIFEQIVSAIAHLHACSPDPICVMDIKLENILYDRLSKSYKLIDFGSATTHTYLTGKLSRDDILKLQDYVNGHCTTMYCAPEAVDVQAARGAVVCERVDVWALGCLWYAMMFNELPFDGASVLAITTGLTMGQKGMMKERAEKFGYPEGFIEVVKSCLIDDPTDRADVFAVLTAVRRMQIGLRTERGVERMRKMRRTTSSSKGLMMMLERDLEESAKRVRQRRNKEFGREPKRVDIELYMDMNMNMDNMSQDDDETTTRRTLPYQETAARSRPRSAHASHVAQSNNTWAQAHYSHEQVNHNQTIGVQQQEQHTLFDATNDSVDKNNEDDDDEWGEFTQNTGSNDGSNIGSAATTQQKETSLIDFSDLTTTRHADPEGGRERPEPKRESGGRGAHADDETDFVKLFQMAMPRNAGGSGHISYVTRKE